MAYFYNNNNNNNNDGSVAADTAAEAAPTLLLHVCDASAAAAAAGAGGGGGGVCEVSRYSTVDALLAAAKAAMKTASAEGPRYLWADAAGLATADERMRLLRGLLAATADDAEGCGGGGGGAAVSAEMLEAVVSPVESDVVMSPALPPPAAAPLTVGCLACQAAEAWADGAPALSDSEAIDAAAANVAWCSFLLAPRLLATFHQRAVAGVAGVAGPARGGPALALARLVACTTAAALPDAAPLLSEVDSVDEMVLLIAPGARDQPDLLRRMALLRRRISGLRGRLYLKERLLQELLALGQGDPLGVGAGDGWPLPAARAGGWDDANDDDDGDEGEGEGQPLAASRGARLPRPGSAAALAAATAEGAECVGAGDAVALYADALDGVREAAERLDDARDILNQANLNFVTGVTMRMSQSSAGLDFKMQALGQVATICLPLNLVASIFGMNCQVPWQGDVEGHDNLHAFGVILGLMVVWCVVCTIPAAVAYMRGNKVLPVVPSD